MAGALDVAEAVRLDDVAELEVDDQPADATRPGFERRGHPPASRARRGASRVLVGPPLPHLHPVVDEGVVHVVADGADRAQVQGAVAEDAARGRRQLGQRLRSVGHAALYQMDGRTSGRAAGGCNPPATGYAGPVSLRRSRHAAPCPQLSPRSRDPAPARARAGGQGRARARRHRHVDPRATATAARTTRPSTPRRKCRSTELVAIPDTRRDPLHAGRREAPSSPSCR